MAEVDLLIKLFDTLKDASKETRDLCHAVLTNQNNIGNYIKNLPMTDLTQALKDHSNRSTSEIGSCTETVESTTDAILNELKNLAEKIKTMIIVVSVAFSLFTLATLIGVISYNIRENTSLETKVEEYTTIQDGHDELKKEIIESIREEFRKK
jgi:gas vesicle protein